MIDNIFTFQRQKGTVKDYLSAGEGKSILKFYQQYKGLDEYHRNKLVNVIVVKEFEVGKYNDETDFKVTTERFQELTSDILALFPNESRELYYIPYNKKTKKKASGKLWEKIQTFKKNLRRGKNLENNRSVIAESPQDRLQSQETDKKLAFLEKYLEPPSIIKEYWIDTVEHRVQLFKDNHSFTITNYMDRFPILRSADGYEYLNQDFKFLYNNSTDNLFKKWPELNEKLITLALNKNKKQLNDILLHRSGHVGFFILPYLLTTPVRKRKSSGIGRYSNQESAHTFITLVSVSISLIV